MNFTIVGAGALGTILGAHLVQAGHAVTMVARGARAEHLRAHGLSVRGLADLAVTCPIVEDTSALGECEVLVLAVKTHQMDAALQSVAHLRPANAVSVANGVMKNEQLATAYGDERVLGCMADTSGELHTDGVAEFTRNVCLNIGAYANPTQVQPDIVAAAIDGAGVVTRAVSNIATVEWSKFVAWSAMFALSLVARRTTGDYLSNPTLAEIAARLVKEAGAVSAHLGVTLTNEAPLPVVDIIESPLADGADAVVKVGGVFATNAPTHRMSSLQDLDAGRRLEVDGTLGYLVRTAQAAGIETPTLSLCHRLAVGIDALQVRS